MSLWTHQALQAQPSPVWAVFSHAHAAICDQKFSRRFSSKKKSCAIRLKATSERRRHIEKLGQYVKEARPRRRPRLRLLLFTYALSPLSTSEMTATPCVSARRAPPKCDPAQQQPQLKPITAATQAAPPALSARRARFSGKKYCGETSPDSATIRSCIGMAAIVAARASGAAAVSTIASFHTHHCAPPSTSRTPLAVASTSSVAARRYHHGGGACCFAAKPTQVAADLVDQDGPDPAAASAEEDAKPRKKARSRRSRNKSAAAQLEEGEEGKGEPAAASAAKEEEAAGAEEGIRALTSLDDVIVNPVGLGRRSRQVFDEVWRKFSRLGQISSASSTALAEEEQAVLIRGGPMCEFTVPGAQDTTVLVVGATSRIGRIVVRKLMLRGYNVKVSKTNFSRLPYAPVH
jgi:hypothetical protein